MEMKEQDRKALAKVGEQCRRDLNYRKRLKASPARVLAEAGVKVDDHVSVELHEDRDDLMHYVMPFRTMSGVMSEADLSQVAGGVPDDVAYGYGSSSGYFAAEYKSWQNRNKSRPGKPKWGNYRDE